MTRRHARLPDALREGRVLVVVVDGGGVNAKAGWAAWLWGLLAGLIEAGVTGVVLGDWEE